MMRKIVSPTIIDIVSTNHYGAPMSIAQRRLEEKDRRRNEILDAAEVAYTAVGWDTVTMDQVAAGARLSRALVYVYFKDKEELLFAISTRALTMLRQRFLEAAERQRTGLAKVEAIGRAYVAYAQEFPAYFDACSRFEAHQPDAVAEGTEEAACLLAGDGVHQVVVASLKQGIADGSVRKDLTDVYATSIAMWGFTHGIIQIVAKKSNSFAHHGVSANTVMTHALTMLRSAIASDNT
jgi:AcrR family transcriptional regulator